MTIGIEYNYVKADGLTTMGVDVTSSDNPEADNCFTSTVTEVGKGGRPTVLIAPSSSIQERSKRATSFHRPHLGLFDRCRRPEIIHFPGAYVADLEKSHGRRRGRARPVAL